MTALGQAARTLEVGEEHLALFPLAPRGDIGVGLGDVPGHVAGAPG